MRNFQRKIWAVLLAAACAIQLAACGQGGAGTGNTETETAKQPAEKEETRAQTKEGAAVSMGRYMETAYPLPEGASGMGRSMALLSDGRLAYFDGESGLWNSADEGKTWESISRPVEEISEYGYVDTSAIGPDGSVGMCLIDADDSGVRAKAGWLDTDGKLTVADGSFADGDWVGGVFFRNEKEMYAVTIRGKVFLFDVEEKALKQVFVAADQPQMLAFSGKKLLALENDGVEIYDLEQGILTDSDPVLDDFCRKNISGKLNNSSGSVGAILLGGEEGVVYLAYDGGLYRHVLGGNALEQVIDGSFSTFGDPSVGLCGMLLLPSGEFLLLTTRDDLVRFTYDPDEPAVPENQLKVYSLEENLGLRQAISMFQKQNPDVYVNYETGLKEDSAVTAADALKNLNVELMSGNGPDVILMDGIDVSVYAGKGMLRDLSGLLDGLTGEEALIPNVAGCGKTGTGTFVVPSVFQVLLICGRTEDISRVKDLKTLADVVEELRAKKADGAITGCYNAGQIIAQLMPMAEGTFLEGRQLNEKSVTEFLTQAKRIYEVEKKGISDYERDQLGGNNRAWSIGSKAPFLAVQQSEIAFGLADGMLGDIGALQRLSEMGFDFGLLSGQEGTGFVPADQLAIAANSTRPEVAEAFVKLMLSCEVQSVDMGNGFPVNQKAFERACEGRAGLSDQSISSSWELEDGTRAKFSFSYPTKEYTDRFREMVLTMNHSLEGNAIVKEAVVKYGVQALEGTRRMEEAVSDIRKAVAIYLAE